MNAASQIDVTPATAYQFRMAHKHGHRIHRSADGAWLIVCNPGRWEYTPGGVGHIPYADEDEAEEWAEAANPIVDQPAPETHAERVARLNPGWAPTPCNSCGDIGCRSRFDCSRK